MRAFFRFVNAGNNLDECALPRAVFTHQRVNFAFLDPEIDLVKRDNAREYLRYALKL